MCGIAGIIDPAATAEARIDVIARMRGAMRHRGPDDSGLDARGVATFGMRRLAIFDPAHGHQPMLSPDRRHTLVFNGAIYNFRALRQELASAWNFKTDCDTEVLLAAYARWGEHCVQRLRGMFAFAVWDDAEQSLFLTRDPFGIKPLYFSHRGMRFLFASELNALLVPGACRAELDTIAVADYLAWLAVPAPRTIYRGIHSLRPGESMTVRDGRMETRRHWDFHGIAPQPASRTRGEFIAGLRERLEDTVRAHAIADVPVGAFLSGGLDSAAVVGLMTRASGTQLRTFSIDFSESGYSEAGRAAITARHFNTTHQSTVLSGSDVARDVEELLRTLDQPTGDGINTYYASKAARDGGVVVALSGLGGDELFGGYPSFRDAPRLARWLPRWHHLPAGFRERVIRHLGAGGTRQRKLADILQHARSIHEIEAMHRRVFSHGDRQSLLGPDALTALGASSPFHPELGELSADLAGAGVFETISAWELRTYMADVLLRDSDIMSMRHSLELRVPLIDRPLIEWLWGQPEEFKSGGAGKSALVDALRDFLPRGVAQSPKRGFALPMDAWMKRDLRPFLDETFSAPSIEKSGMFAVPAAQQLWRDYLGGRDTRRWSRVWSLAVLIAFANRRFASENSRLVLERPAGAADRPATSSVAAPPPEQVKAPSTTLLLAPEIFTSEGGIPRILQAYLRALCEIAGPAGKVRLLALNDAAIDPADLRRHANGVGVESHACSRGKLHFIRQAIRMSRGCDRIVCGHVFLLPVAWLARRLNPRLRYYLVAHGIEIWRPFTVKERVALRGAERIFCVSDFTRRELLKHVPLANGRAVVLHNALDPFFAIEPGRPLAACAPVILVVTRLTYADRYKGVQHMIEAMPAIRAAIPAAQLRIVGRGDDVPRLEKLRDQLGLGDAVEFTGYLDDERLADEMRSCRLFALPSRKEGFGLVFLEAMAKGRPCLGARAGGVPEVITAETGSLIEYGDLAGIARACIGALQRDWDQQAIMARARAFTYAPFKTRLRELLAA
ncbi:MAG: asparagine synthase (glutamine-hydrolyzing) [Opitutaceae bacterium]|nr:asparagine synthase (glutamine-hydrolyzing) [Opitutaceae bacterium]